MLYKSTFTYLLTYLLMLQSTSDLSATNMLFEAVLNFLNYFA